MSDIRLVKLKSGEEIIGDVTVIDKDVIISNPCQIMPTDQGLGFAPWPPFATVSYTHLTLPTILLV